MKLFKYDKLIQFKEDIGSERVVICNNNKKK